jgi:hypothetical protein
MLEEKLQVPYHVHDGVDTPKIKQTKVRMAYNESQVVKLTGNQTIAGVKTFSSVPVLPSSAPTTDNQAVRKHYIDNLIPGFEIVPSDFTRDTGGTGYGNETSYVKLGEVRFNDVAGRIRVSFGLRSSSSPTKTAYGRIYINGSAVGTERSTTSGTYVTYTEDFTIATNDLVQLYAKTASDGQYSTSSFNLKYDKTFNVIPGTVNS